MNTYGIVAIVKGIILAGGSGTRLYPLTISTSKQMLPVYDKPMVYYPLSVLMMAGIRDILIISTPVDLPKFKKLLGSGEDFGIKLSYAEQPTPDGLAQAFIIGEKFIEGQPCAMILGDNIFHGNNFDTMLKDAVEDAKKGISTIFGYHVIDPERFGVVEFEPDGTVRSIEEKPEKPKSEYAVTGLYFYNSDVTTLAKEVKPSQRGELEITDLNNLYLNQKRLRVRLLDDSFSWWDTGTFDSLIDASCKVRDHFKKTGLSICSPESISFKSGWISKEQLISIADRNGKSPYGAFLRKVAED